MLVYIQVYMQVYMYLHNIDIYIQVAHNFDAFYAAELKVGVIFTQTKTLYVMVEAPGACPWMGPGVRMGWG